MSVLHILLNANLGGCERNCEMYVQAASTESHFILVLGKEGAISKQLSSKAEVVHLDVLNSKKRMLSMLERWSRQHKYSKIMYWSVSNFPIVRYAFREQNCVFAAHVGNPLNLGLFDTMKFKLLHYLLRTNQDTLLFCCSEYVRLSVKNNKYFSRFKTVVAYNPVKTLSVNPYFARCLTKDDVIVFGMTARLDTIKDHKTVLNSFSKVVEQYSKAQLWLFGEGHLRLELERQCVELGIQAQVVFYGNVQDVYSYLNKLDIFVYSTTVAEGLGNAVIEAMSNGLPCVISDLPMLREVAGNDGAVLFFPPKDVDVFTEQLLLLIKNEQLREALSRKAFNRANAFFSAEGYVKERLII